MALTVWTTVGSPRLWKARIAAQYTGVEIKEVPVTMGVTNKTPEYLANFPLGKVPAALTADGLPLVESGAIARHVARVNPAAGLMGSSFYQGSLVDQWIDFNSFEIESFHMQLMYPALGFMPYVEATFNEAKEKVLKALKALNNHLVANTFVTGDTITLADIVLFCTVNLLFTNIYTQAIADEQLPSVVRWYNTLAIQPQFKAVVTNTEILKTEKKFGAAAAAAPAPKEEKKAEAAPAPAAEVAAPTPEPAKPEPKAEAKKGKKESGKKAAEPKAEAKKEEVPPPSPKVEAKKAPEPKAEAKKETPKKAAEPKVAQSPKAAAPKAGGKAKSSGKK